MGDAKRIIVQPISATDAKALVRRHHYSGKVVNNSQLHLGVFLDGKCGGAMQFGPSLDKRKMLGLVEGTLWNEFLELNRMAFADWLPRNSESRALGAAFRFIRKTYPHIKWCVSFADATQCGDGTIYRASGFVLTGIKQNNSTFTLPSGEVVNVVTYSKHKHAEQNNGSACGKKLLQRLGATQSAGFQLRYLYFIDPTARQRLTVPVLPFSEIDRMKAGMYRGIPRVGSADGGTAGIQPVGGGSNPTPTLLSSNKANA